MKSIKHNQSLYKLLQKACSVLILAAFFCALLAIQPAQAAMHQIYITNVTNAGFTVSWTTDETNVAGYVEYGLSASLGTQIDDLVVGSTHYVEITGLNAGTEYYYQVNGDPTTLSTVTTGPVLDAPGGGSSIVGYVYESDGMTPVQNAIVYLRLVDNDGSDSPGVSQWRSVRTGGDGGYILSLAGIRLDDFSDYFEFSGSGGDLVEILGQGGASGTGQDTVPSPVLPFIEVLITLDGTPNAISLASLSAYSSSFAWAPVALIFVSAVALFAVKKFRG